MNRKAHFVNKFASVLGDFCRLLRILWIFVQFCYDVIKWIQNQQRITVVMGDNYIKLHVFNICRSFEIRGRRSATTIFRNGRVKRAECVRRSKHSMGNRVKQSKKKSEQIIRRKILFWEKSFRKHINLINNCLLTLLSNKHYLFVFSRATKTMKLDISEIKLKRKLKLKLLLINYGLINRSNQNYVCWVRLNFKIIDAQSPANVLPVLPNKKNWYDWY